MSLLAAGAAKAGPWFPPQASTVAGEVDWLYGFIFWISLFFFALIVMLVALFIWRYHERPGHETDHSAPHHHHGLELAWSGIPLVLVIIIFYLGFTGFMHQQVPPGNSYQIGVTGQKWKWLFTYPNGYVDPDLHVPVEHPVALTMTSEDVIHSLYIPAFRVKRDVVPGRYSKLWFEATKTGEYPVYCAEYCGSGVE